jgi:hypothetical protein
MNKKALLGVLGVLAVGGAAYYYYFYVRKQSNAAQTDVPQDTSIPQETTTLPPVTWVAPASSDTQIKLANSPVVTNILANQLKLTRPLSGLGEGYLMWE